LIANKRRGSCKRLPVFYKNCRFSGDIAGHVSRLPGTDFPEDGAGIVRAVGVEETLSARIIILPVFLGG
jgi:hypothetical protein